MKTRSWIVVFAAVIALSALVMCLSGRNRSADTALVYRDGVLIETLNVNPAEPYTLELSGEWGENTLLVGGGTVRVTEADCTSRTCIAHGALRPGGSPIVCLPHRLVIEWAEKSSGLDAVSGVAG